MKCKHRLAPDLSIFEPSRSLSDLLMCDSTDFGGFVISGVGVEVFGSVVVQEDNVRCMQKDLQIQPSDHIS